MESHELAANIAQLILEKKGYDVLLIELKGLTTITDFFVVCTVDSDVQAKAIKDHIKDELIYQSVRPWHIEGSKDMNWVLMDFVDVVVHIFQKEAREFYTLERLWGDATITEVKDNDETSGIHTE